MATKDQHIVPRYHIRNFSIKEDKVYKAHIYNIESGEYIGYYPSETHFKKRNVYEVKNENGVPINLNMAENNLCKQENAHRWIISDIIGRVNNCHNKELKPIILSQEEIIHLAGILSLQFFRTTAILQELENKIENYISKRSYLSKLPTHKPKDLTYKGCLMSQTTNTKTCSAPPIPGILQCVLMLFTCSLGYAEQGNIILGDHPYYFPNGDKSCRKLDSKIGVIIYPLTSHLVLCFHSLKFFKQKHQRLFILSDNDIVAINKRIAKGSKIICSKTEIDISTLMH